LKEEWGKRPTGNRPLKKSGTPKTEPALRKGWGGEGGRKKIERDFEIKTETPK